MAKAKKAKNPKLVGTKRERDAALAAEADAMTAADAPPATDAGEQPDDDITTLTKKVTRIVREASPRKQARGGITPEAAAEIAQLAPVPAPRSHAILFAQKTAAKAAAIGRTLAAESKRRGTGKRASSRELARKR